MEKVWFSDAGHHLVSTQFPRILVCTSIYDKRIVSSSEICLSIVQGKHARQQESANHKLNQPEIQGTSASSDGEVSGWWSHRSWVRTTISHRNSVSLNIFMLPPTRDATMVSTTRVMPQWSVRHARRLRNLRQFLRSLQGHAIPAVCSCRSVGVHSGVCGLHEV